MPKQFFTGLFVVIAMVLVSGCASTPTAGGITTKAYMSDKERVDQDMEGGNYGYLAGTPQPADRSQMKKTRKIYVVEFTKEPPAEAESAVAPAPAPASEYQAPAEEARAQEPAGRTIDLPNFDNQSAPSAEPAAQAPAEVSGGGQEYTIQKDDTLQKISKKFYNTYSKWPKIYEANKNVIPNPNRIKSGTKIVIP